MRSSERPAHHASFCSYGALSPCSFELVQFGERPDRAERLHHLYPNDLLGASDWVNRPYLWHLAHHAVVRPPMVARRKGIPCFGQRPF